MLLAMEIVSAHLTTTSMESIARSSVLVLQRSRMAVAINHTHEMNTVAMLRVQTDTRLIMHVHNTTEHQTLPTIVTKSVASRASAAMDRHTVKVAIVLRVRA